MKVTIVYESMFGNTHEVAQAIGDGIRNAQPDADVQCVGVVDASPELIKSTDLLVIGGPTHIRGMTSGLSRRMGISGEQNAEAKGEPAHELEEDAEGPGVREWFKGLPKLEDGSPAAASTPALSPQWLAERPAALPDGYVSTATGWSANRRGLSWKMRTDRCSQVRSIGRSNGERS